MMIMRLPPLLLVRRSLLNRLLYLRILRFPISPQWTSRDVNTVFQSYALFPHMTIFDNVAYGLRMKKVSKDEIRERVMEMLDPAELGYSSKKESHCSIKVIPINDAALGRKDAVLGVGLATALRVTGDGDAGLATGLGLECGELGMDARCLNMRFLPDHELRVPRSLPRRL